MIGRGSMGNPILFKRCLALLETGKNILEPSKKDKIRSFLRFAGLYQKQKRQSVSEFRQHASWFVKGLEGAAQIRKEIMDLKKVDDILDFFMKLV